MAVNLSSDNPLCIESKEIYTDVWLIALFCSTLLLDIIAFVCCVAGAKSVYNTQLLHINLRICLFSISLGLLFRAVFTAFRCIRYLVHAVVLTNPCDFLEMTSFCNNYSGLQSWGYNVVMYTIPIITVERMIALFVSSRYEAWTLPKFMTFINILTWVHGGILCFLKRAQTVVDHPVVYCSSFSRSYYNATIIDLMDAAFLVPFTCLCIDIVMHLYCKYIVNKQFRNEFHEHSLTHRFQLNEILRTSKIAIPASSLFCILNTQSSLTIFIPVSMGYISSTLEFSLYKELSSLTVMPVYTTIYGILLYWYNVRPISTNRQCCPRKKRVTPAASASDAARERAGKETDAYFEIYSARW
uniref:G protein-coupled receptor n=1 Tax=Panagrellus redivivus TaxID=6233 RepID=A0A7E4UWX6_PANRE